MSEVLVDVQNVSKKFSRDLKRSLLYGVQDVARELVGQPVRETLREEEFWAVRDVSFTLRRGESMGIIGANGAGKTTLLRLLNGLIKPTTGYISMRGRIQALIALNAGVNPVLSGRENIYINAATFGIPRSVVDEVLQDIIDFAEIGDFIDTPMRNYSSGMKVRLGFAVAIHVKPDILIIDEVLAVGDARFRRKARNAMARLLSEDVAIIFISHNMHEVLAVTERVLWLDKGRPIMQDNSEQVCAEYLKAMSRDSDSDTTSQNDFIYGQKRTGELAVTQITVNSNDEQQQVASNHTQEIKNVMGQTTPIRFDVELQAEDTIDERVFHQLVLKVEDGENIGQIILNDYIVLSAGDTVVYRYEFDISRLLLGNYTLSYHLATDGGPQLESILNFLNIIVEAPRFSHTTEQAAPVLERLAISNRGAILLPITMLLQTTQ